MNAAAIREAAESIAAAAQLTEGLPTGRVFSDPGAQPSVYPAIIVGPPAVSWEGIYRGATDATFLVYVITEVGAKAMENLWDLVPLVAEAIDSGSVGAVLRADPGVYTVGGTDMPCYEITVEIGL